MIVKHAYLKNIGLDTKTMFKILEVIREDIPDVVFDVVGDELVIYIPEKYEDEYKKIIKDIYEKACDEFLKSGYNKEYRLHNAKIINFLDKLCLNNKVTINNN